MDNITDFQQWNNPQDTTYYIVVCIWNDYERGEFFFAYSEKNIALQCVRYYAEFTPRVYLTVVLNG